MPNSNTGSHETWSMISEWVQNCEKNHPQCAKFGKHQPNWYPTRLIDLGPASTSFRNPRLVETSHAEVNGAYVTLSHCWGNNILLTLTTENLEAFRSGIIYDTLPKTFRDAVLATRKLGLRYMWIDSLCILQSGSDSKDDWQHESALMHKIYENAYCNIGATAAENSHEGLFFDRNPEVIDVSHVYFDWWAAGKKHRGEYIIVDPTILTRNFALAPLLQRGWVFQERLLAPRMLHFCSQEVVWECRTGTFCETFREGLPLRFIDSRFMAINPPIWTTTPKGLPKIKIQKVWHDVVKGYTRCRLTYEGDKLLALSGIAQNFQFYLDSDDEYLAGIWRKSLPDSLLWIAKGGPQRVQTYRAPSWSWASVEGHISYDLEVHGEMSNLLTVLDSHVSTYTSNKTGQVIDGSITVFGYIVVKSYTPSTQADSPVSYKIQGDFNPQEERIMWYPDDGSEIVKKDMLCLPVRVTAFGQLHGIVLARLDGSTLQYRRTGAFSARDFDLDLWVAGERERIVIV